MTADSPPTVLFLCSRNTARSQMAEAWLRHLAADRFVSCSAGLDPGEIHPLAAEVMEEAGISLEGQSSKSVRDYLGRLSPRYVIIVCSEAETRCPKLWPFCPTILSWPLEDPVTAASDPEGQRQAFRRVRDQLRKQIADWLETLPDSA